MAKSLIPHPAAQLFAPRRPSGGPPGAGTGAGTSAGPDPGTLRAFGDTAKTRQFIDDDVLAAIRSLPPREDERHRLELKDVRYVDPPEFSVKRRKAALLGGGTLGRRVRGTWTLVDKATGQVVDRRQQVVARVPHLDDMGTFIHNGSAYALLHQQRLRPGIYTRRRANGEIASHVNVLPGHGVSHHVTLDPDRGVFHVKVHQARVPLVPLLRALGTTDRALQDAWGPDLFAANGRHDDAAALTKLREKFLTRVEREAGGNPGDQLAAALKRMELAPDITRRTLGQPYAHQGKDALLATTKKLLAVHRGEAAVDDRDHPAYQTFLGPEDLLAERVTKDHGRIQRQAFWEASRQGNLAKMPSGLFTPQLEAAILHSGLGQNLEEINALEVFDKQSRISRMGEGGLPSLEAIPEESRSVLPGHLGFLDPTRTPECHDAATEVMTRNGWKAWPDVVLEDELACLIDGALAWHRPAALHVHDYDDLMYGAKTKRVEYLVTPGHRMWTRPVDGTLGYRIVTANEMVGKRRALQTGHDPYEPAEPVEEFQLPPIEQTSNGMRQVRHPFPMKDWAELLGWYLSEGSTVYVEKQRSAKRRGGAFRVDISQSRTANLANCFRIGSLLSRFGFPWSYNRSGGSFCIGFKQIASYMRQFGDCYQKFIPAEIFETSVAVRRRFVAAMLAGDGRRSKRGKLYQLCTASPQLAKDFQRLVFSLGIPSTISLDKDKRYPNYPGTYVVNLHDQGERHIGKKQYFVQEYRGKVYCATVPGGLLYVRRGRTSGHWSGNSLRAGVDLNLTSGARKGRNGAIYAQFRNPHTRQLEWKSPRDLIDAVVAFPGWHNQPTKRVTAIAGGTMQPVKKREVTHSLPHMEAAFSPLANLVPFKSAVKAQRVAMGSRMLTQALPLVGAEAPLVRGAVPGTGGQRSWEEAYGVHAGAIKSEKAGRVASVDPEDGTITLRHDDGTTRTVELYQNFPMNRKTTFHQEPVVAPGQTVVPGQLLARSNYTDGAGAAALGMNVRTAYLPWMGYNFEDATVISQSLADRMKSEHAYQHELELTPQHKLGKRDYLGLFPARFEKHHLANLDERGIVKPGTVVAHGDPLILAAREKPAVPGKVHRTGSPGHSDATITWDHHDPGVVTDAVWGAHGPVVMVKSQAQTRVADKLAGRFGDKSVIAHIVPDAEMPVDSGGRPFEMLANPLGVISRGNPGQMAELWLGKVAVHTGRVQKVEDFDDSKDLMAHVAEQLRRHGLSGTEDLTDPTTGRKIPGVATGMRFMMKLHHTAESGLQARGSGGYSAEETPTKGGPAGCFTAGTALKLWGGGTARIGDLVEGLCPATVESRRPDPEAPRVEARAVVDWFKYRAHPDELRVVALENGEQIEVTTAHVFYLADGREVAVRDLVPGMDLLE